MSKYKYPASDNDRGVFESQNSNEVVEFWNQIENQNLEKLIARNFSKNAPFKSKKILDIGAGTGRIFDLFGNTGNWTLLEPDESRAQIAKKKVKGKKAKVVVGEFQSMNFPKHSFDIVFCNHLIQHISESDYLDLLKIVKRITKPSGFFVLGFTVKNIFFEKYYLQWNFDNATKMSHVPRDVFNIVAEQKIPNILPIKKIDIDELRADLKELNFSLLDKQFSLPFFSSSLEHKLIDYLYQLIPLGYSHDFLRFVKYKYFYDCIVVAQKQ